jgi:hypothetical protein
LRILGWWCSGGLRLTLDEQVKFEIVTYMPEATNQHPKATRNKIT